MADRIRELNDYLDGERAGLRAALDSVPHVMQDQAPAPDQWSAAGVVEHLALVERRIAGVLRARIEAARNEDKAPPSPTGPTSFDRNAIVDRTTRRTAAAPVQPTGLGARAAWAELEQTGVALRDTLSAGSGLPLDAIQHPHPALGPLSLYQWVEFVGAHEARHAAQIREIAAALAPASA